MFSSNHVFCCALALMALLGFFTPFGSAVAGAGDPSCPAHNAACLTGASNANWVGLGWSRAKCAKSFAACQASCQQNPDAGGWPGWDGGGRIYPASCPVTMKGNRR